MGAVWTVLKWFTCQDNPAALSQIICKGLIPFSDWFQKTSAPFYCLFSYLFTQPGNKPICLFYTNTKWNKIPTSYDTEVRGRKESFLTWSYGRSSRGPHYSWKTSDADGMGVGGRKPTTASPGRVICTRRVVAYKKGGDCILRPLTLSSLTHEVMQE